VRESRGALEMVEVIDSLEVFVVGWRRLLGLEGCVRWLLGERSKLRFLLAGFLGELVGGVFPAFWVGLH